ncbi:MAG: 2-oxoacid:acceptor oxidoreductase subunit alpha [Candidatus Eremiobacteraeota bacterium]|nr:2-oxoacid:acceptor oxidoreductase subunit alpha [Candidatus Eremiobacteraeota bacterium]MBV9057245.1 2-oxoacid:acceptor oxidoreductase subunit alpha [Candidatus Eremiobacteraeota bacterium]MBV9699444.1 2-oxoacid:acceptor oxidoreductase subunit alpha [Candidatus Eremiobacteraeota bacterium]
MSARAVNDFTIRVATVNGSGSQSSNLVLTNAIARLGIPVAPKNVFPSNIEGLPTWFDVRVSALGYQCRARDFDVLVALNAATWQQDVAGVKSGGAVVHEESFPCKGDALREDLTYYAVPFTALAKEHFADKGDLRKYLMNMIYVGVVAQVLEIPEATIEESLRTQFRRKPKAVELNMAAVNVGLEYARGHLEKRDPWRLVPMTGKTDGLTFMEGNRASALGCIMGGCTVAAWYPITPSSSLCEYFIQYCERHRIDEDTGEHNFAIVQAEDELAAAGIVFGAGWAGARAMTSTSGPGISLMAEYAGYGYFAEVPGVIFDVQRAGPSTGLPTRTMQGDVSFAYTLSHGDTKHIVLLPATVAEAYEFATEAFDLAERFQTPVFVLSDLDLGMNSWLTPPLRYPEKPFDRGKVLGAEDLASMKAWGRYRDVDKDGIPYRTLPGTKHPNAGFFTRGTGHDEEARYSEMPDVWQRSLDRLVRKHDTARTVVPSPLAEEKKGTKAAIIGYGTTHHAIVEARDFLRDAGIELDYLRVRALPLSPDVATFITRHERVYVVEQNRDGQLYGIMRTELPTHLVGRLESIRHYNGVPIDAHAIIDPLLELERTPAVVAE